MKKYLLVPMGLLLCSFAFAETRVVTINTETIAEKSKKVMKAREAFQRDYQRQAKKIQDMEANLEKLQEEYSKKIESATQKERQEMEEIIKRKMSDYQALSVAVQESLMKKQEELLKPIMDKVEEIAKKNGYDIVFDLATGKILYASSKDDVTQQMIKEMD